MTDVWVDAPEFPDELKKEMEEIIKSLDLLFLGYFINESMDNYQARLITGDILGRCKKLTEGK